MESGEAGILLTKIVGQILSPMGAGLIVLFAGILATFGGWIRTGRVLLVLSLVSLWAASLRPVANWAIGTLEAQYPPRPISETPVADAAILLGGGVDNPKRPRIDAELNDGGDRVIHAARLFHSGKVRRILVTGGNLPWAHGGPSEAEHMRAYLVELGVPLSAIAIAGASRNTVENAQEISALWKRDSLTSALLVTSAFHMPRALRIFESADLPVTPSSTDVRGVGPAEWTVLDALPDAEAMALTTRAAKEWIGLFAVQSGLQN